jgi:S1-C subfamily serine protease
VVTLRDLLEFLSLKLELESPGEEAAPLPAGPAPLPQQPNERKEKEMRSGALTKVVLLASLLALAGSLYFFGTSALEKISYAVAVGRAEAARQRLSEMSRRDRTSPLFRAVAEASKPSVVVVNVKKRLKVQPMPMPGMDDFLRRFFGEGSPMPSPFGPRRKQEEPPRRFYARGLGSGVIVDAEKGTVLTNWHVVRGADEVEIDLGGGRKREAEWVRSDRYTDVAVIKVDPEGLLAAPFGDSDAVQVGDRVLAIGAPEGLPQTVTAGIISAKGRTTT